MKVLVTGHSGYVGSILMRQLVERDFEAIGYDTDFFPQGFVKSNYTCSKYVKKDIRDVTKTDLKNCFAVIHLAALSNDPLGEINPSLTNEINFLATVRLAKLAMESGVERFVFSSSCSNYGFSKNILDESSSLDPITAYAKSKVNCEQKLLELKNEDFSPVILRNATAYGISPSQRLDLVVNNLVGSVVSTGKIQILSDGTAWRPLVHVEDMASAFINVLKAKKHEIRGEVFNVGATEENFTVRDIAEKVKEIVPNSRIEYGKNGNKDTRSYKVNFDKIKVNLGYKTKWRLKDGIKQIFKVFKDKQMNEMDFNNKSFYRVAYLKWLIQTNVINSNLRFIDKK